MKNPYKLLLIFLTPILSGICVPDFCRLSKSAYAEETAKEAQTVLLVGGLNGNSASLAPIAERIRGAGFHVFELLLAGHTDEAARNDRWDNADANHWMNEVITAKNKIFETTRPENFSIVAYSTGALATLAANTKDDLQASRMIFIAPPIRLTARAGLMRVVSPFAFTGIRIPSFTPKLLRAHHAVPLQIYAALFELIDTIDTRRTDQLPQQNISVMLSPQDELVSASRVRDWIANRRLPWKIIEIQPDKSSQCYAHLIIHPCPYSREGWEQFTAELLKNLQ